MRQCNCRIRIFLTEYRHAYPQGAFQIRSRLYQTALICERDANIVERRRRIFKFQLQAILHFFELFALLAQTLIQSCFLGIERNRLVAVAG